MLFINLINFVLLFSLMLFINLIKKMFKNKIKILQDSSSKPDSDDNEKADTPSAPDLTAAPTLQLDGKVPSSEENSQKDSSPPALERIKMDPPTDER